MRKTITVPLKRTEGTHAAERCGGDLDFAGHGPRMHVEVKLRPANNEVKADVFLKAKETRADWTCMQGRMTFTVFRAPSSVKVLAIEEDTATADYIDQDHDTDWIRPSSGPVEAFECWGDRHGNDHPAVRVYFRAAKLTLEHPDDVEVVTLPDSRWFRPPLVGGDADFDTSDSSTTFLGMGGPKYMHGEVEARLTVSDGRRVQVTLKMEASEDGGDDTYVKGEYTYTAHTSVPKIVGVLSDRLSHAEFRTNVHDVIEASQSLGELVHRFDIRGDRRGADAEVWTGVKAKFNPLFLKVER